MPRELIDLADEAKREMLKRWMVRVLDVAVEQAAESFMKGAKNAIAEAADLLKNPRYQQERRRVVARKSKADAENEKRRAEREVGRVIIDSILEEAGR